jgi:hypothetical protein
MSVGCANNSQLFFPDDVCAMQNILYNNLLHDSPPVKKHTAFVQAVDQKRSLVADCYFNVT